MSQNEKHYPSMRYHGRHGAVRVNSPDHEAEVAHPHKGWVESPADLEPAEDASVCAHCGQELPAKDVPAAQPAEPESADRPARTARAKKAKAAEEQPE